MIAKEGRSYDHLYKLWDWTRVSTIFPCGALALNDVLVCQRRFLNYCDRKGVEE